MILSFHNFAVDIAPHESWGMHIGFLAISVASLIAVLRLFIPKQLPEWSVRLFGGMAVGALAAYFISRFASQGVDPLGNIFEILIMISTGLIAIGLAAQWRKPQPGLNAVLYPIAVILMLMAFSLADTFGPAAMSDDKRQSMADPLLIGHIVLAVVATAQLAFAAVVSGVYLAQDRALSAKRDGLLFRSLPSIETMRRYIEVAIDVGFVCLTISLGLGFAVIADSLLAWLSDPMVATSIGMWVLFAIVAIGRRVGPLYGKRVVYAVLTGFVLVAAFYIWMGMREDAPHSFERNAPDVSRDPSSAAFRSGQGGEG